MGGSLAIESTLGRGTTARVSIPLAPVPKAETEATCEVAPQEQVQGTALVVDDSAPARELLSALLALSGVDTLEADSADQARTLAASRAIDIVFLDYQMPGSDGAQTAATLRRVLTARDPSRRVPIYILTANVFAREQLKEAAESVDDILTKPLSRAALGRLLRAVRRPAASRRDLLDDAVVGELQNVRAKDGQPMLTRLWPKVAQDMDQALRALSEAERQRAHEQIARQAHVAAGNAAFVGARVTAELARALEDGAASHDTDLATLSKLIAALHTSWAEARIELEARVHALERGSA
jgi:CheY-like chemotaxis protein